jgi:hypothetical protein
MIDDYLSQTCYQRNRLGTADGYGQPAFGSVKKTACRWTQKRRVVRNSNGDQVISEVSVTLPGSTVLLPGDQLSLDDETWLTVISTGGGTGLEGETILVRAFL